MKMMKLEMSRKEEQKRKEREQLELELESRQKNDESRKQKKEQLKHKIKDLSRQIAEANECAKILKKDIHFTYQMVGVIPENIMNSQPLEDLKNRQDDFQIKVENHENENCYIWSTEKFCNKLLMMRDVISNFYETGELPDLDPNDDPFFDFAEPLLIGQGYYKLEGLAFLIDNPAVVSIIGTSSTGIAQLVHGKLEVNIIPVD